MIHAHRYQHTVITDIDVAENDDLFAKEQAVAVSNNPFMCVKYFHHRKAGILKYLFGGTREPLGGKIIDAVIKSEFQRTGGLHMHAVLWIARKLNMRSEELFQCEEGLEQVRRVIGGMYDGTIPGGLRCSDLVPSNPAAVLDPEVVVPKPIAKAALNKVRSRARPPIPNADNDELCQQDYRYCVIAKQAHYCCFTCH
jgi:hypothetical protein